MRISISHALLLPPLLLVACGGTLPTNTDGGVDASADSSRDAQADAKGDGGACVPEPQVGTACAPGEIACDVVIGCCSPMIGCNPTTKKWEVVPTGCPCQSFTCGDKTCMGNQVCQKQYGGVPLPDGGVSIFYSCVPYPAACARQQTCECLTKSPPAGCMPQPNGCTGTPTGNTLSCMGS